MSYILDAIKKSEAERGHGSIPGLQTVHSSSLSYKTDNKQLWPYVIIGLLLLNFAGLIFYYTSSNTVDISEASTSDAQTVVYTEPFRQQPSTTKAVIRSNPAIQQISTPVSDPVIDEPQIETQAANNAQQVSAQSPVINEVVDIEDLPANIKQYIPPMRFTGHVYSSSPLQRSIIINGSFMEEGESVGNDVILAEITRRGAIFNYEDILFEVNILTGWNVN